MFSAKMVCLIQKLFGRDENSATNDPDLLSSLDINSTVTAVTARRPRQTETVDNICGQSYCPDNRRSTANITLTDSDGMSRRSSPQSRHRSQSMSTPTCKDIMDIDNPMSHHRRRIAFAKQDASSAPKHPPSARSSFSSWSEDALLSNRPVSRGSLGSAEPVCCCDACLYILDSTLPSTAQQDMTSPPCFLPPDYDEAIGCTQPVLPLSIVSSYPVNSTSSSCVKRYSSQASSAAMTPFHYEKTPHRTKPPDLPQPPRVAIESLPPMINISPDGEEGFANSQRVLQHSSRHYKPFCEVPPNKTICHVHWKSVNDK